VAAVILYPAIDLKDGQCVRVVHGDFATATVFNDSPADQARTWAAAGFEWLHVVDLNGSAEGRAVNGAAVEAILQTVSIPVQLGGGVRSLANIEAWIEAGVSRVILGTAAVRDPELVKTAARAWPEQIAVSVDVRKGQVAVQGWLEDSGLDALTVARRFEDAGVSALIVTDIDRDGALTGFNTEVFGAMADAVHIPVIAAGGIMDGRGIAAALMLGAAGAQMGTAFLSCPESGIPAAWREALFTARDDQTRVSRIYSGRHARGIVNEFMRKLTPVANEIPPYPIHNALTGPIRQAAGKANRPEYLSLWAGQAASMSRGLPAVELFNALVDETRATLRLACGAADTPA